jgi:hypothetical protein
MYTRFPGTKTRPSAALEIMALGEAERIERNEVDTAERAARLRVLFDSEVWKLDMLPLLHLVYDETLEAVKRKVFDPDALIVLDNYIILLHASLVRGFGAMERVANKRLKASDQTDQINPF